MAAALGCRRCFRSPVPNLQAAVCLQSHSCPGSRSAGGSLLLLGLRSLGVLLILGVLRGGLRARVLGLLSNRGWVIALGSAYGRPNPQTCC